METGVQPDMVTFAGSSTVLTADEGEPREGYGDGIVDPRGSVTVADVSTLTSEVVALTLSTPAVTSWPQPGSC